jgi:hypothetical protein
MKVTFCGPFAMSLFKGGADLRAMKTGQRLMEKKIEAKFHFACSTELITMISIFKFTKPAIYPSLFSGKTIINFGVSHREEGAADVG